jgi:16S rRNA (guanine966-N2)-methyltransferase
MARVIAGTAGGRRLTMPRGRATRPTADRVREGLFSSLGGSLAGRSFLDLYAGSGAVGIEAASRGAAPVLLVERDARALAALHVNLEATALSGVSVRGDAVERVLAAQPAAAFDVCFLDPPYATAVEPTLDLLVGNGWLAADGLVVVERASRDGEPGWPAPVVTERSRRYGDSTLWYGRRP